MGRYRRSMGNGESSFVYWESAMGGRERRDRANKMTMTWNIMSAMTSYPGPCTAWPTRNWPSIRQLGCSRPKRGSIRQEKKKEE